MTPYSRRARLSVFPSAGCGTDALTRKELRRMPLASGSQSVCCELHMAEVLIELLEYVQHDRSVGRIAAEQELSAAIIAAFTSIETTEVVHSELDRTGDGHLEFVERSDSGEF